MDSNPVALGDRGDMPHRWGFLCEHPWEIFFIAPLWTPSFYSPPCTGCCCFGYCNFGALILNFVGLRFTVVELTCLFSSFPDAKTFLSVYFQKTLPTGECLGPPPLPPSGVKSGRGRMSDRIRESPRWETPQQGVRPSVWSVGPGLSYKPNRTIKPGGVSADGARILL